MLFGLLLSDETENLYTFNIIITYIDDNSYAENIEIELDAVNYVSTFDTERTSSAGEVTFTSLPPGLYNIIINSEIIDTINITENVQHSYQVTKISNVLDGLLYNKYVAENVLLAPTGWHVPTETEFDTLLANYSTEEDAYTALIDGGSSGFDFKWSGGRGGVSGLFSTGLSTYTILGSSSGYSLISRSAAHRMFTAPTNLNSGRFIRLVSDSPSTWVSGDVVTDLDGNIYNTVKIGTQVWTVQNFACTQLNDTTLIDNVRLATDWVALSTGGYCAYENNSQNVFVSYTESNVLNGRLYNWYSVNNASGIAESDLLMPNNTDWEILTNYIETLHYGQSDTVALFMKSVLNWDGIYNINFESIPTGIRDDIGVFSLSTTRTSLWTSNYVLPIAAISKKLTTSVGNVVQVLESPINGFSIRMLVNPSAENENYALDGAKYTDQDGNVYDIVQIGTQFWLGQNWACTKYADGSTIPELRDDTPWTADTIGAQCVYDNDNSYIYK